MKFKSTNVEKLIGMHQDEQEEQCLLTVDEKKKKFEEYKQLLNRQVWDLSCVFLIKDNFLFVL